MGKGASKLGTFLNHKHLYSVNIICILLYSKSLNEPPPWAHLFLRFSLEAYLRGDLTNLSGGDDILFDIYLPISYLLIL